MASENRDYASSVGEAIQQNRVYGTQHPRYTAFSSQVNVVLDELVQRDTIRRQSAKPVVVTQSLNAQEVSTLGDLYPEFQVRPLSLNVSTNPLWTASRVLANQWLMQSLDRVAKRKIAIGGNVLQTIMNMDRDVHIERSANGFFDVHDVYSDALDVTRIGRDYVTAAKVTGITLDRNEYLAYDLGQAYGLCTDLNRCTHKAAGISVDLSLYAMSPAQLGVAMEQHESSVAMGFFIFHPDMLVNKRGTIPGTDVGYRRTESFLEIIHPGGTLGVTKYSLNTWTSWLTSHTFGVGTSGKTWFHLELLKNRGWFMFFRVTRVDGPNFETIRHALDLPSNEDMTLVSSWKLKSLLDDPDDFKSWTKNNFMVPSRVVTRVKEFAMQLPAKDFNRQNIRKQISLVNNRWVLAGTTVTVNETLDPQKIEDLTVAIFAKAFVDRYDSSRLSMELMGKLKQVSSFQSYSTFDRVKIVAATILRDFVVETMRFGWVNSKTRSFVDGIREMLGSISPDRSIDFLPAPTYMLVSTRLSRWREFIGARPEVLSTPMCDPAFSVQPDTPAATATAFVARSVINGVGAMSDGCIQISRSVVDIFDMRADVGGGDSEAPDFVSEVARLNEVAPLKDTRHNLQMEIACRVESMEEEFASADDDDPAGTLTDAYNEILGDVAKNELEADSFSLSLDPQDRVLAAPYLRMQKYFGLPPAPREYYKSRIVALNVPKRQNTSQELLSAVGARNLSAPVVSEPQQVDETVKDIFNTFLDSWCVEDARQKLVDYQADPVALEEGALRDWTSKCKPEVVRRLYQEMKDFDSSLGNKNVSDYVTMIKSDVKPTLSNKPVHKLTAPQTIVYHDKLLSGLYSSMFRVLVRRFLSLLKPNIHVNLLKDMTDIRMFIQGSHGFGREHKYLENDFSQFDKSQSDFAFALEEFVFRQLGLNEDMLRAWSFGHVECSIRSIATGLSLHVLYQRKSGDATTAFGNVILNVLSVCYAYKGTVVEWGLFMGDDSLLCVREVIASRDPVRVMAEIFNLSAKNFITDAPYFASNFIVFDGNNHTVAVVPDPIKRIERLSMYISADDPQWNERFVSYRDSLKPYRELSSRVGLARCVTQRYQMSEGMVRGCAKALSTISVKKEKFRSIWYDEPIQLMG